jgi:hypothetical protein
MFTLEMDMIEFEWCRCLDGYRIDRSGLRSASERFERYRPLETPALFAKFADAPHNAEGLLKFCNQFGLLGGGRPDIALGQGKPGPQWEHEEELLRHHAKMRGALYLFEKGDSSQLIKRWNKEQQSLALIRAELRTDPDGKLRMVFVPPDLIRAMWLQFAQHAGSAERLFRCQRCNEPFTVGPGTGRRGTAMYCSNACKVVVFQARKKGRSAHA